MNPLDPTGSNERANLRIAKRQAFYTAVKKAFTPGTGSYAGPTAKQLQRFNPPKTNLDLPRLKTPPVAPRKPLGTPVPSRRIFDDESSFYGKDRQKPTFYGKGGIL